VRAEPLVALNVTFVIRMLAAVDFDNQAPLSADKICNEWT